MKTLLLLLSFTLLIFTSCKRVGCKDDAAINHDEKAKVDNGSCLYESQTSFWFNKTTSDNLTMSQGVTELTVFIDNVSVGTMDPTDWKIGPDCGGDNFNFDNDLGSSSSLSFDYLVNDQSGITRFSGSFVVGANECLSIRLF